MSAWLAKAGAEPMDHLTVVGGLAPYLLVPPESLPGEVRHVGTLDLGLELASSQEPRLYDHGRRHECKA